MCRRRILDIEIPSTAARESFLVDDDEEEEEEEEDYHTLDGHNDDDITINRFQRRHSTPNMTTTATDNSPAHQLVNSIIRVENLLTTMENLVDGMWEDERFQGM